MTQDGSRIAVVSYENGQLEVLNGQGELLWRYASTGWVRAFAISPAGNRVAVVSYEDGDLSVLGGDGELLRKRESVGRLWSLPEHQHWSLAWTHDCSSLILGCAQVGPTCGRKASVTARRSSSPVHRSGCGHAGSNESGVGSASTTANGSTGRGRRVTRFWSVQAMAPRGAGFITAGLGRTRPSTRTSITLTRCSSTSTSRRAGPRREGPSTIDAVDATRQGPILTSEATGRSRIAGPRPCRCLPC